MPFAGGLTPGPWRLGGGVAGTRDPRLMSVVRSIQAQRGPAYTQNLQSAVGVENIAMARAIDRDAYGAMERLTSDFDPQRMQIMLPRWESIFGITPSPSDSFGVRRQRILARWAMTGAPNTASAVQSGLQVLLGPVFVNVQTVGPFTRALGPGVGVALAWWPGLAGSAGSIVFHSGSINEFTFDSNFTIPVFGCFYGANLTISNAATSANNGTYEVIIQPLSPANTVEYINPLGSANDFGVGGTSQNPTIVWSLTNTAGATWTSLTAHIVIQLTQPPNYSNAQFQAAVAQIGPFLDGFLPAWTTWDWWVPSPNIGNFVVGPNAFNAQMGFVLDDQSNLDFEMLDA